MTGKKSALDAHIIKKYASVSTMSKCSSNTDDPDKIWNTLGAMAVQNLAIQIMRRPMEAV